MVTIKQIAELCGVSRGTVDRVLNNRGSVKPEKRQLVLDTARKLHYQPNPAGKALAWKSQIDLHADAAPAPAPAQPEPSLELAQRTLDYAHRAGLVKALMLTAGASNDGELIDWMQCQGDLWFSLCRLTGLAEAKQ